MVLTAFVFTKYMWIWLIRSTVHLNSSEKNFSTFFVFFSGRRHPTYSCNCLDCICVYKIHVNMINTINLSSIFGVCKCLIKNKIIIEKIITVLEGTVFTDIRALAPDKFLSVEITISSFWLTLSLLEIFIAVTFTCS